MCYYTKQTLTLEELEKRFNVKTKHGESIKPNYYNGFEHPKTPVITNDQPNIIQLFDWGLLPSWAKDINHRKYTLNARIETINIKPSYRNVTNNRCLILSDGFIEWQWLDPKGRHKQKNVFTLPGNESFGFAGLWSQWLDQSTGELLNTYTLLTMEANDKMNEFLKYNPRKRMLIIVSEEIEKDWLLGGELKIQNDNIIATKI